MNRTCFQWIFIIMAIFLINCTNDKKPEKVIRDIQVAEPLRYVRIYSDAKGESHFADEQMSFQLVLYSNDAKKKLAELF